MPRRLAWNSIRWRAALMTSALVAVALASFIAVTLRQVSADVRQRAMDRSAAAATILASLTSQQTLQGHRRIQDLANSAALRTFLESPNAESRERAVAAINRLPGGRSEFSLWDRRGQLVLAVPEPTPESSSPGLTDAPPAQPGLGPLLERGGRVFTRTATVVTSDDESTVIGHLVFVRAVDSSASSSFITGMVGEHARLFIGNFTGDVWTDLERAVPAPSLDLASAGPREFTGSGGERMIGTPVRIPNTPWVVLLALPSAIVMAPVWELFRDLAITSVLATLLVTVGAVLLSARVTRPLDALTGAAQAIAAGDYARRVKTSGQDELGRLGEAFNAMAHQVEQSRGDLEARARELVASREEARRANDAKDEFLAMLSHELRTPLTAMLGWGHLIRMGGVAPQQLSHALDVIDRNARAQLRLVDDLLDVSRIIVGRFALDVAAVDATAVVHTAVESIRPAATTKGVSVRATLAEHAHLARADAGRLQQAVGNLLSNALKFTPAGGRIDVSLAHERDGIEIVVRDTGDGVEADELPFIFDRLHQADGRVERRHSGLGLGLAIVRQVVELHGGTVRAESDGRGRGATFRLWIPIGDADDAALGNRDAPAISADRTGAQLSVDGVKCLVVDDSEDAREMVAALLSLRGADVTTVDSAEAALHAIDRQMPDVLLSDLAMPGQTGLELIGHIRSRPADRGGSIPAVALTAYAAPEDRDRSIEAGFDAHLVKPVDAEELVGTVARLRR